MPFSHEHHVGGLGIDCRYCHTRSRRRRIAGIPPTKTCMNCHSQIWTRQPDARAGARELPHRRARSSGCGSTTCPTSSTSTTAIHVNKGVGCATCHGRVDQMPLMWQAELAADGVVPRLPPRTRSATCGRSEEVFNDGLAAARATSSSWAASWSKRVRRADRAPTARRATDERRDDLDAAPRRSPASRRARERGRRYWQSLEELAGDAGVPRVPAPRVPASRRPSFDDPVGRRELPEADGRVARRWPGSPAARASPTEKIVPYVKAPEDIVPGQPLFFATADAAAAATRTGVLVESHMGRPDEDRGQPRAPGEPRRDRRLRAGRDARPLRPRPLAGRHAPRARSGTWDAFVAALRAALDGAARAAAAQACAS